MFNWKMRGIKEKRNIENSSEVSTKSNKKNVIITAVIVALAIVSCIATMGSMIYFKTQVIDDEALSDLPYKEYDRYYALVTRDRLDTYWTAAFERMKAEGEATGAYVEKMGDNLAVGYSEQELMKIAIDSNVDGIIYEADDSSQSRALINRATAAGIPVVTVRTDSASSSRKSFVGVSYYNLGTEYGKLILKASRSVGKRHTNEEENPAIKVSVLVDGTTQDTSQNITITALKEIIQKKSDSYPEIEIDTIEIDNTGEFTAEESIRDMFQSPALAEIIVCLNEVNTVSVYQTIVEQNKVGKHIILGYYDSEAILKAIEKKVIYATITVDTEQLGGDCVDALNEYIEYGRVSEYYGVDYKIISADNIGEYLGKEVYDE